ncbi:hypothetical protein BBP40_001413 [Aspergillus hancockii]|nr:hypothetical protein BBP40_001413 [Aspergillus hancockii]
MWLVEEQHDEEWDLDEAQEELTSDTRAGYNATNPSSEQLAGSFLQNFSDHHHTHQLPILDYRIRRYSRSDDPNPENGVSSEQVDERRKRNTYFDKINEGFFRPRGLYCLVMTWNPESSSTMTSFDLNSAIATSMEHGGPGVINKMKHKLKSSHGETPKPEFTSRYADSSHPASSGSALGLITGEH